MFGQDADEPLDGTKYHAVNHDRPVFLSIRSHIFRFKTHRKLEIQLDRAALPGPSDGIFQMEIDFRAVKCPVAFIYHIVQAQFVQRLSQTVRSHFPVFIASYAVFRPGGKFHMVLKSKQAVYLVDQPGNSLNLLCNLLLGHEDVGIVLGKTADAHQPVKLSRLFMAVHQPQLAHAQGQIPVRPGLRLINQHSARTVHGFYGKVRVVDHRGVHIFFIMIPMP